MLLWVSVCRSQETWEGWLFTQLKNVGGKLLAAEMSPVELMVWGEKEAATWDRRCLPKGYSTHPTLWSAVMEKRGQGRGKREISYHFNRCVE